MGASITNVYHCGRLGRLTPSRHWAAIAEMPSAAAAGITLETLTRPHKPVAQATA